MPLDLTLTQLGLLAGSIVTLSNAPDIIGSFIKPQRAPNTKVLRDGLACVGNLIWIRVGLLSDVAPIAIFCGLSALMLFALVVMQVWLRCRPAFKKIISETEREIQ